MKSKLKVLSFVLALLLMLTALSACSKDTDLTDPANDPKPNESSEDKNNEGDSTNDPNAQLLTAVHPLTGLPCTEQDALNRPVAFMIDNEVSHNFGRYSNLGICDADIIYETNIEANGSGTRMMAVFSQSTLNQKDFEVGAIRSARPYFMTLAKMLDAFYIHEGASSADEADPATAAPAREYARGMLNSGYLNSYELECDGTISYRDKNGYSDKLSIATAPGIIANTKEAVNHLKTLYNRSEYKEGANNKAFCFGENHLSDATTANKVRIQFSYWNPGYTQSEFTYDAESGLYVRSQYLYTSTLRTINPTPVASPDIKTGEKLEFKNVFVLSTDQYAYDRQPNGNAFHIKVDLTGESGEGYYFTEGKYIKITWTGSTDTEPLRFYTEDGNELMVNSGKTFVNLVDSDVFHKIAIS